MFVIAGIFDKLFKRKERPVEEDEYYDYEQQGPQSFPQDMVEGGLSPEYYNEPTELDLNSKIFYNQKGLDYRLKMHNKSIDMLGDITVHLDSRKKSIAIPLKSESVYEMLEPEKSAVLKFKIKPKYKPGKTSLYGRIEYFDFKSKERKIVRLPRAIVNFEIKNLTPKRVNDDGWRQAISGLNNFEIETEIIETQPSKLFDVFKGVLHDLGLFMLPPIENVNLYRGIAKFFGFDKNNNIYAVETQIIGDKKRSKVLLRIWSSETRNAMALAFKTLDVIEDIIEIKKFIVET